MDSWLNKCWLKKSAIAAILLFCTTAGAQQELVIADEDNAADSTIETLVSFVELQQRLQNDIEAINIRIKESPSELQTTQLQRQLEKLKTEQQATAKNFKDIAAGVDISSLRDDEEQAFNLQKEMLALIKPAFDELKDMTSQARKKSELKEKLAYSQVRLPVIARALENIVRLQEDSGNDSLNGALELTAQSWKKQQSFLESEAQAAQLQLDNLLASRVSFVAGTQSYFKSFFKKRGLFLIEALFVIILIIVLSRLTHSTMYKLLPGFHVKHRSFRVRVYELAHRVITGFFIVIGPMIVFYFAEDWVLFSLGILVLFSLAWTLRHALPRYWQQIHLYLNIGSVREGERILYEGLPWRVEEINFYCNLFNPLANISQRIPIHEMVDMKSRAYDSNEPWFPCKKGDWVFLADGVRGRVTGISPEMVQLIERGGARRTYLTTDFLANSPRNLTANFRIKELIGLSYSLQSESTHEIPEILHSFILERAQQEGYGEDLLNLRVEFAQANVSSLDIVVVADFKGHLGELYNRLRRTIQRWCVEACTENGWEIPFPQMTLHGQLGRAESIQSRE